MIHLFIDTNIFLSFYRFSNDQLNKLEELGLLIRSKKVKLYLTEQVINEFNRNRENVFKETIKLIIEFSPNFPVPNMVRDMKETKSIVALLKRIEVKKRRLVERLNRQFKYSTLKIDKLMNEIVSLTNTLEITDSYYNRGLKRYNLGNPPGKNKSYGDAVNWEVLLESVPRRQPLYFIGNDGDYLSPLHKSQFSHFLNSEWKMKKGSSVILFNSILEFLKKKNPASKVTKEEVKKEKEIAIDKTQNYHISSLMNAMNNPLYNNFTTEKIRESIASLNLDRQNYSQTNIHDLLEAQKPYFSAYQEALKMINAYKHDIVRDRLKD